MKEFAKENKILLLLVAIALIFCFSVIGARYFVESGDKTYDIVLDYQEIEAMAKQSKRDVSWWLSEFKSMGITKVGLAEESLNSLMTSGDLPVSATLMETVVKDVRWRGEYPAEWLAMVDRRGFGKYDVMVETGSEEAWNFVASALEKRFGSKNILFFKSENGGYALLSGTPGLTLYSEQYKLIDSKSRGFLEVIDILGSKLNYASLGMLPEKVGRIQALGMEIVPRTNSYNDWNDTKYAKAVVEDYEKYGIVPEYMIVGGESVIGFDDGTEFALDYVKDNHITVGLIEDTTQLQNILQYGLDEIAEESGYQTVRVFSVWNYIQNRYQYYGYKGAEEIENTLYRAVSERNIRIIYFKPFKEAKDYHTYLTKVEEYRVLFENLQRRLSEHGLSMGSASVMRPYQLPFVSKFITALGCAFAGILLLHTVFPLSAKRKRILAALGTLGVAASFYVAPNFTELVAAFAAAIVFACLAVIFFTRQCREYMKIAGRDGQGDGFSLGMIIALAAFTLILSVLIALIGGMMTAAPLSSVNYMLEIDIFRGVKASQLLPIAFFAVAYLAYFGFSLKKRTPGKLEFYDLKEIAAIPIRVWMLLLGIVLAGVGYYYIMRTGHESASVEVSDLEMLFRNALEELFIARPRNKEFLFAFPAIMLMVYAACRQLKFWTVLFGVCGVVGVTSVINTFMHIRTPLYLGFVRTGFSLAFGVVTGCVAILIFEGFYRLYKNYKKALLRVPSENG
ncbi:MAG: DUF5693 family protein [Clostridiales Family XIII bacterium]|nr:DUF5693 family protein [Clostridiales Family XIII bacterium]